MRSPCFAIKRPASEGARVRLPMQATPQYMKCSVSLRKIDVAMLISVPEMHSSRIMIWTCADSDVERIVAGFQMRSNCTGYETQPMLCQVCYVRYAMSGMYVRYVMSGMYVRYVAYWVEVGSWHQEPLPYPSLQFAVDPSGMLLRPVK
jgi:hypothetical protein